MNPQQTTEVRELQNRFAELPQEIMDIIVDGTLDAVTIILQETFTLTEDQVRLLENEIILTLCFFAPRDEFVTNVTEALQVDANTAAAIGTDVEENIFELVSEYFEVIENGDTNLAEDQTKIDANRELSKKASLAALAESFEKRTPEPGVAPTPTEPQEPLTTVEPLRTMQGDINRIHGYGAFNEAKENDTETK